jgi:hypothetical protein
VLLAASGTLDITVLLEGSRTSPSLRFQALDPFADDYLGPISILTPRSGESIKAFRSLFHAKIISITEVVRNPSSGDVSVA